MLITDVRTTYDLALFYTLSVIRYVLQPGIKCGLEMESLMHCVVYFQSLVSHITWSVSSFIV
jgi:hypothetical protein